MTKPTPDPPSLEYRLRVATRGRFEILEPIGRGGMASVFRARDLGLGREVAIKVLSDHVLSDESSIDRFIEEARAVAALDHPNIVKVFSVERHEDVHFLVLQLVHGSSLAQVLGRGRLLDVGMVKRWFGEIADAMDYSHRCGIVHRDIKPGNVLIRDTGEAVLTDFGIAKATTTPDLTRTGFLVGTPDYMSPEQCGGDPERVGPASDQYALGIVLYEALSGRNPFSGRGDQFLALSKQLESVAPPLSSVRAEVPEDLSSVVARMLAKDSADRFESVSAAARAAGCRPTGLGAPRGGKGGASAKTSGPVRLGPSPSEPSGPRGKRRGWRWLLLGSPALIAAVILASNLPAPTAAGGGDAEAAAPEIAGPPPGDTTDSGEGAEELPRRPEVGPGGAAGGGPGATPTGAPAGGDGPVASGPIDASGSLALGGANEIIAVLDLGGAIPEGLWCAALDVAVNEGPLAEIHRDDVRAGGATRLRLTASLDEATADQESEPLSAVQARGRVRLTRGACPLPGEDRRPEFVVDLAPVCAQRLLSGAWFPCR